MSEQSFFDRHYHLIRRLHSLTGIVPIGAYMFVHLLTNSSIVWGAINTHKGTTASERAAATFQHEVDFIHSLPALILVEVGLIWIPLIFHIALGFVFARSGHSNLDRYKYQANARYSLQRLSGYIGALFIFYHVATLRWGWTWLPYASQFNARAAAETTALALQGGTPGLGLDGVLVSLFYLVGGSLLVFHFANGLWTAAITWGLTISAQAQRRWGYVCAGLGALMMAMTWMAVIGFAILKVDPASIDTRTGPAATQPDGRAAPAGEH